jgi:hypothetical protein
MSHFRRCTNFVPVVFILPLVLIACATPTSSVGTSPAPVAAPPAATQQPPVAGTYDTSATPGFTSRGEENDHALEQYDKETRCRRGNHSKGAPMICVDNVTIRPNPYSAEVWDFQGQNGMPTDRPVVIHWFARRGGDLRIEFQPSEKQCVENLVCDKGGAHCSAVVLPLGCAPSRTCTYHVWIDDVILDKSSPGVRVNPCCW